MDRYVIRVNGKEYEVEIERKDGGITAVPVKNPSDAAVTKQGVSSDTKENSASAAGEKVTAGTAGKVWKVTADEGDLVKRGDSIVVLEAMKMEIPVVAPCDGKVGKLLVSEGDSVDMGQAIAIVA